MSNRNIQCSKCGQNRCSECGSPTGWRNIVESAVLIVSFLSALIGLGAAIYSHNEKVKVVEVAGTVSKMSVVISAGTPNLSEEYKQKLAEFQAVLMPYLTDDSRREVKYLIHEVQAKSEGPQ